MKKRILLQCVFLIIGIILIFSMPAFGQIDENYRENRKKAYEANSAAECKASLKFCNEALKAVPNHPVHYYLSARLNEQLGNNDLAFKQLKKATKLGYSTKMLFHEIHQLNDTAFIALRDKEAFKEIIEIMKESEKPVHKSQIAFTISDKELNPEGIAYDPVEKMFYLGSLNNHKIIKVDPIGKCTDFINEGQEGLNRIMGIHVDPIRRILWAASFAEERNEVLKYNLSSGKLIRKYFFPPDGINHNFNDLVIHPNGDIYISGGCSIYTIPQFSDKLELFLKSNSFAGLNGITLSDDGRVIYVSDYFIGIYKIDIQTKSFSLMSHEPGFNPFGVDGLYFSNNHLYAVQDVLNTIDSFSLNEDATHIESCEIFERNSPYLYKPTTGVIVDDYFYFIADTQGKAYRQEGVIVMKTSIKQNLKY
ncbi:hypothetical protein ACFL4T_13420 [candidate division KSB1 bacterium]